MGSMAGVSPTFSHMVATLLPLLSSTVITVCAANTHDEKIPGVFEGTYICLSVESLRLKKKAEHGETLQNMRFSPYFSCFKTALNLTMYLKKYSFLYHQINLNWDH